MLDFSYGTRPFMGDYKVKVDFFEINAEDEDGEQYQLCEFDRFANERTDVKYYGRLFVESEYLLGIAKDVVKHWHNREKMEAIAMRAARSIADVEQVSVASVEISSALEA